MYKNVSGWQLNWYSCRIEPRKGAPMPRKFLCLLSVSAALVCVPQGQAQINDAPSAFEQVFYASGNLKIEAYVFKPQGKGPFPVVIYNHGSRPGHERAERPFAYVGKML